MTSSVVKEEEVFIKDSSFLKNDFLHKSEGLSNEDLMELSTQNSISTKSGHNTLEKQKDAGFISL